MKHYGNMMEAISNFFNAMQAEHEALIAESNAQAAEARNLITRVQNTMEKHEELNTVMGMVAVRVNDGCDLLKTATNNIKNALEDIIDGEIPTCSLEVFEGYCDKCGEEVASGWKCVGNDGALLCPTCYNAEITEAEPVDAEPEVVEA